jgi:antitoxin ParD1/3/4
MAISVDLGEQLEQVVDGLLSSGRYNSKSEVLREGVRLVQEREAKLAALDLAIAQGVADAEAGRTLPIGPAFDRIEERLRNLVGSTAP